MRNIETVQQIYQAFGTGDVPSILARMAPDVEWERWVQPPRAPWLQARRGPDGVGAFFGALAEHLEFLDFGVDDLLDGGDVVVALVRLRVRHRQTGRELTTVDEPHVWRFDAAGRVVRFRHAIDPAPHDALLPTA